RRPVARAALRLGFAAVLVRAAAVAVVVAVVVAVRFLPEPRGRPGPRRPATAAATLARAEPPTPAKADAAASRRRYSSTAGRSFLSRSRISRCFSSRKSFTFFPVHPCGWASRLSSPYTTSLVQSLV